MTEGEGRIPELFRAFKEFLESRMNTYEYFGFDSRMTFYDWLRGNYYFHCCIGRKQIIVSFQTLFMDANNYIMGI